jgi:hypothetical protein
MIAAIYARKSTDQNGVADERYCGHTLQAEAEVNRQGEWIGQCIVEAPAFKGTIALYSPLPTPQAALDAILAAGRRSVDEQRGAA